MPRARFNRIQHILARERGAITKDWGGRLPIALVYPNTYRVGMSSLGLHTVYRMLNDHADVVCERAFWEPNQATPSGPSAQSGEPMVSIESQRPLADFAVIAFSISFEMDYPHIVQILRRSGIPLWSQERDASWPLVIGGGPAVSANPLPVADLFDGVVVGEAEEVLAPLVETLWDVLSGPRDAAWQALARIPGIYVPHGQAALAPVRRQWVHDLDAYPTTTVIHTPDTEFGGIHLIEIARGCGRGCRFCMAGFTYRPKRERSLENLLEQARRGLAQSERIGLVGAAVSDYTQIDELATGLRKLGARLSVSSLRVDPLSDALLQALAESGTQTLTLAPEAGSERLRRMINKGITEADLMSAVERANAHRFRQLKLYFMLGLPTEEEQDVIEIARLCEAAAERFSGRITASITPFVPKAHTPFQWMAVTSAEIVQERLRTLQKQLAKHRIPVKGESPRWSTIQAILARGDRQLASALVSLDGNTIRDWQQALSEHDLQPYDLLGAREINDPLPWDFIDTGVSKAYLRREWERAQSRDPTAACPLSDCRQCGVCPGG